MYFNSDFYEDLNIFSSMKNPFASNVAANFENENISISCASHWKLVLHLKNAFISLEERILKFLMGKRLSNACVRDKTVLDKF